MPKKTTSRSRVTLALSMPDRTVQFLMVASGAIFTLYIGLVIFTITLATMQTSLAAQVRETEGSIAALESTYYEAVARENQASPASAGLVAPTSVVYATAQKGEGISFARN